MPSVEELCFMIDRKRYEQWELRTNGDTIIDTLDIEEDIRPLAQWCITMGAKVVVIKCGARGMFYMSSPSSALGRLEQVLGIDRFDWGLKGRI